MSFLYRNNKIIFSLREEDFIAACMRKEPVSIFGTAQLPDTFLLLLCVCFQNMK